MTTQKIKTHLAFILTKIYSCCELDRHYLQHFAWNADSATREAIEDAPNIQYAPEVSDARKGLKTKNETVEIFKNGSLHTRVLILAHQKETAEVQKLFVCQYGHKMVYKGSTFSRNGMNKMIYLVCSSRIFDMLGYV